MPASSLSCAQLLKAVCSSHYPRVASGCEGNPYRAFPDVPPIRDPHVTICDLGLSKVAWHWLILLAIQSRARLVPGMKLDLI